LELKEKSNKAWEGKKSKVPFSVALLFLVNAVLDFELKTSILRNPYFIHAITESDNLSRDLYDTLMKKEI
jgi:hypothetical protein